MYPNISRLWLNAAPRPHRISQCLQWSCRHAAWVCALDTSRVGAFYEIGIFSVRAYLSNGKLIGTYMCNLISARLYTIFHSRNYVVIQPPTLLLINFYYTLAREYWRTRCWPVIRCCFQRFDDILSSAVGSGDEPVACLQTAGPGHPLAFFHGSAVLTPIHPFLRPIASNLPTRFSSRSAS